MTITLHKVHVAPDGKMSIERRRYDTFLGLFKEGKFGTQRLGQAFYDHFKLDRMNDQSKVSGIYARDGEAAKAYIEGVFNINT